MAHTQAEPIGGPLLTKGFKLILGILGVWLILLIWRYAVGLGPVTGLTDGYPWGIWIAFDVVTGTALACGGYAIAILTYILNKGKYHPLVRPALLTSALGYSMAALAIVIDVGRWWGIWRIPLGGFPDMAATTGTRRCSRWPSASWPMWASSGSSSVRPSSSSGRRRPRTRAW